MRLIDADAVAKELDEYNEFAVFDCESVKDIIDNAPTIIWCSENSEGLPLMNLRPRPQGEWTIIDDDHASFRFKICSNCGKEAEWLDGGSQFLSNFCPNCGAKMKKGGSEC